MDELTVSAITLVMDDLEEAERWYGVVFGWTPTHRDDDSVVFRLGPTMINLLRASAAPELVAPTTVAPVAAGSRVVLTLPEDDVDARCRQLREAGINLLSGPIDRPWGPRTASVRDPGGHIWEFAN